MFLIHAHLSTSAARRNARPFARLAALPPAIRKERFSRRKPDFNSKGAAALRSKLGTLPGQADWERAQAVTATAEKACTVQGPVSSPGRSPQIWEVETANPGWPRGAWSSGERKSASTPWDRGEKELFDERETQRNEMKRSKVHGCQETRPARNIPGQTIPPAFAHAQRPNSIPVVMVPLGSTPRPIHSLPGWLG